MSQSARLMARRSGVRVALSIAGAVAHLVLASGSQQLGAQPSDAAAVVDRVIAEEMAARKIPGLQLAIVRGGRVVLHREYGLANLQDSVPVTRTTLFTINSMTKAFTGVAIVQLAETGALELDAPIGRYLPALPEAWRQVTVKQLLIHSSGLPDITDPNARMLSELGDDSSWAMVQRLSMLSAPGERFIYNQNNYLLLGKIIDSLTGRPFTEVITERQLKPAGMTRTIEAGFGDSRDVLPRSVRVYTFREVVGPTTYETRTLRNLHEIYSPFLLTAAGIRSTALELAQWLIALRDGRIFRRAESLATLWTPGRLADGSVGGFDELLNGWALGWPVAVRDAHPAVGAIGGGRSGLLVYPKDDLAVVVLTNLQGADPEAFIDRLAAPYLR